MILKSDSVEEEENRYRDVVLELPDDRKKEFYKLSMKRIKDPDTYATLNWFFIAGLHHFYLGKFVRGIINLTFFVVGILIIFTGYAIIGYMMLIFIIAVELWALFRSQIIIKHFNNLATKKILTKMDVKLDS